MVGLERSNLILLEGDLTSKEDKALRDAVNSSRAIIHFSNIDKVGINPRSEFKTPIGVYGYLLTKDSYHCVAKKPWGESHIHGTKLTGLRAAFAPTEYSVTTHSCGFDSFATTRKFVHVAAVSSSISDNRILWIGYDNSKSITDDKLGECLNILIRVVTTGREIKGVRPEMLSDQFKDTVSVAARSVGDVGAVESAIFRGVKQRSPQASAKLWSLTFKASKSPVMWNKLLRAFGFDAVFDNGTGTIHFNEPSQGVVLKPGAADRVYSALNPLSSFRLPIAAGVPAELDADFATPKSKNYFYPPIYKAFHEMLMAKMDRTSKSFKQSLMGIGDPTNPVVLSKRSRYAEKRLNSDLAGQVSWSGGSMDVDAEVDKSRIEYFVSLSDMSDGYLYLGLRDIRVSFDEEEGTVRIGSLDRSFGRFKLSRAGVLFDVVEKTKGEDVATQMLVKYIVKQNLRPKKFEVPKAAFRGESKAVGKIVHVFGQVVQEFVYDLVDSLESKLKDLPKSDLEVVMAEAESLLSGPDSIFAHLFKL